MKLEKYLNQRAQTRAFQKVPAKLAGIKQIVVVPARGEFQNLPACLSSLARNTEAQCGVTWCVVVVNNPSPPHPGWEYRQDNQRTLEWLKQRENGSPFFVLSFIDAASAGCELSPSGGVGLARKIGADSAIEQLARQQKLSSAAKSSVKQKILLFHLDADTLCESDYLKNARHGLAETESESGVVDFQHQAASDPVHQQAIDRYELYMRCYVHGLRWAGSPYAFHTVGSTMVSTVDAYIRAGGIPAGRAAGEDFYFLQQLAKTGGITNLGTAVVYPSSRLSKRVLFGTGRHIASSLESAEPVPIFDPPEAFSGLKKLLQVIHGNLDKEAEPILQELRKENSTAADFLFQCNFPEVWQKLRQQYGSRKTGMVKAFHQWFDALATRQLIHTLSKHRLPFSVAWPQWVKLTGVPPRSSIKEALVWLRNKQKRGTIFSPPEED